MRARGFTLVEVMVVIVVMGILASLLLMNISGVDRRQAMQARELLITDLKAIQRLATEQGQVLAFDLRPQHNAMQYQLLQYQAQQTEQAKKWQTFELFDIRTLAPEMSLDITPIEQNYPNANNLELIGAQAPKLIWLGNGEAKPVRIQAYWQDQAIGAEIEIDYLGKVHEK